MKKIDHGMGAIGLVLLFAILSCFVVTAFPIIKSEPPAHTQDWLGFAGGVVGGVMTLIAACIAWVAVQKQITAQAEISESQIAIQRFNISAGKIAHIEEEIRLADSIQLACTVAVANNISMRGSVDPIASWRATRMEEVVKERMKDLSVALREFESANQGKVAFLAGAVARQDFVIAVTEFNVQLASLFGIVKMAAVGIENEIDPINTVQNEEWRAFELQPACDELREKRINYITLLRSELRRLRAIAIDVSRKYDF